MPPKDTAEDVQVAAEALASEEGIIDFGEATAEDVSTDGPEELMQVPGDDAPGKDLDDEAVTIEEEGEKPSEEAPEAVKPAEEKPEDLDEENFVELELDNGVKVLIPEGQEQAARDSMLRHGDYTRKTQEVAAERKRLEESQQQTLSAYTSINRVLALAQSDPEVAEILDAKLAGRNIDPSKLTSLVRHAGQQQPGMELKPEWFETDEYGRQTLKPEALVDIQRSAVEQAKEFFQAELQGLKTQQDDQVGKLQIAFFADRANQCGEVAEEFWKQVTDPETGQPVKYDASTGAPPPKVIQDVIAYAGRTGLYNQFASGPRQARQTLQQCYDAVTESHRLEQAKQEGRKVVKIRRDRAGAASVGAAVKKPTTAASPQSQKHLTSDERMDLGERLALAMVRGQ